MEQTQFKIGQRVMVIHKNNYSNIGSIKYIGQVKDVKGQWFGVELDSAQGKNDGSTKGVKYFACKPGHGVFLKEHHFIPYKMGMDILSYEEYEKQQQKTKIPLSQQVQNKTLKTPLSQKVIGQSKAKELVVKKEIIKEEKVIKQEEKVVKQEEKIIKQEEKSKDISRITSDISLNAGKQISSNIKQDNVHLSELREQINKYLIELKEKDGKIFEQQQQADALNTRIFSMQNKNQEMENKIALLESQSQQQRLTDNSKEVEELGKKLRMFMKKNQSLEEDLKKSQINNNTTNLVEKLTLELSEKEGNIAELNQQMEVLTNEQLEFFQENSDLQGQVTQLRQQLEYLQQQQMTYDSQTEGLSDEQLREQNNKLKIAVQILNENLQEEKDSSLKKLQKYEMALQCVPELQEKVRAQESQQKENQQKEHTIKELKDQLDDLGDAKNMIEMMTREVIKKDSEILEQQDKMQELQEGREIDNEFIEEYTQLNTILQHQIDQAEINSKIQDNKFDEVVQKLSEHNGLVEKYKYKLEEKEKEQSELKAELQNKDEGQTYKKLEDLGQKVQQQQLENTQIYGKYVQQQQMYLQICQEIQVANIYLKKLPKDLLEKLNINSFRQFLQVEGMVARTQFIVKEIMEKYLNSASFNTQHTSPALQKWLISYLIYSLDIIYYSEIFMNFVQKALNNEKYQEVVKRGQVFNQLASVNVLISKMIKYLQEENLSNKISLEPYKNFVSKLGESVMSLFRNQEYSTGGVIEIQVANYKRKIGKVGLLVQLYSLTEDLQKPVQECLNKWLNRLRQYYFKAVQKSVLYRECERQSVIQVIMDIDSQTDTLTVIEEYLEQQTETTLNPKEVYDKLESEIQVNIVISDKEKEILDYLETEEYLYGENTAKGPWDENIENTYGELQRVMDQQQELQDLKDSQQVLLSQQSQQEVRQLEDQRIRTELQKRVGELQMKAERAVILEKDKDRLMEQQQMFRENEARLKEEYERLVSEMKDQKEVVAELKENQGSIIDHRRTDQDNGDEHDGSGEDKYYKVICKKMVMDIYKLKAGHVANKFTDLKLDQSFNQVQQLRTHRQQNQPLQGSSGEASTNNNNNQSHFNLRKKRQEMRMMMATQKIIEVKQGTDSTNQLKAINNQYDDIKLQANMIYQKFHNQISSDIKQQVKTLGSEKNTVRLGSVSYNTNDSNNVDILVDVEQYSKVKDWLFKLS